MSYTKGLWKIFRPHKIMYSVPIRQIVVLAYGTRICEITHDPEHEEEAEANASLISASPDLYEACKTMLAIFDRGLEFNSVGKRACEEAQAAIRKAERKEK